MNLLVTNNSRMGRVTGDLGNFYKKINLFFALNSNNITDHCNCFCVIPCLSSSDIFLNVGNVFIPASIIAFRTGCFATGNMVAIFQSKHCYVFVQLHR